MEDFDDREPWLVIADRLHERSTAFHQAALEFLKKADENHLNAAIAIRCNQEATKLDLSLMKVIYPYSGSPESRRRKLPKHPNPELTSSLEALFQPEGEPSPELTNLLEALFQPEEEEQYAPMDTGSTTETVREDSPVATVEA